MAFNKHRLEYVTKKRFSGAAKQTVVYCATKRASAIYGGRRPPINRLQANHNAHMATVLAHVLIHKPEIATGFVAEHALRWHRNSKRPDAVVYGDDFQAIEVHESGGTGYPATRIEAHFNWVRKWAETQDLHYFFW